MTINLRPFIRSNIDKLPIYYKSENDKSFGLMVVFLGLASSLLGFLPIILVSDRKVIE